MKRADASLKKKNINKDKKNVKKLFNKARFADVWIKVE